MSKKMSNFTYRPGKSISSVEKQYNIKNVIKLASNENPFGPSSKALKTVKKELKTKPQHKGYTRKAGRPKKRVMKAEIPKPRIIVIRKKK